MEISRYIVHRATMAEAVPAVVLRLAVREMLVLAKIEKERMAELGLEDRWAALGDAVDAWLSRGRRSGPPDRSRCSRALAGGLGQRRSGGRPRAAALTGIMARLIRRSLRCTPVERAAIGERAEAAGMPVSHFLVACALHEDAGAPPPRGAPAGAHGGGTAGIV